MKNLILILIFSILALIGCEKDSGFGLEIYTLRAYQTKPHSQEIISGTEKLTKNPIISYDDIIFYDSTNHYFMIDSLKAKELWKTNWPTQGTPFALTINREVIYSGNFVPGYSSSGSDWYTIDPLNLNGKLRVTLGYPFSQVKSSDLRNDYRIIDFLKADNKLNH
jgi:hypothetical protein